MRRNNGMTYRQTKVAYIVKYALYKWVVALITLGYVAIYDFFKYKRHSITLNENSIRLQYGVFTQNSRELPYRNIQGVSIDQSVLGQIFNYGSVVIGTASQSDSIVFEYVDSPKMLRQAIQDKLSSKS